MPVLLLRRGPLAMRALAELQDDPRIELFVADELTQDWRSFSKRVAATLVATERDPLSALGYAVTAGINGPIVMAMAKRYESERKDLLAAGAVTCVIMPVKRADVDALVPILMKHAGPARMDATLRLLLDPISRVVRYRDKVARLSLREFALLHCLSAQHGRPVAADALLTYVWGDAHAGAAGGERSRQILDVYIFQLRRKLTSLGLEGAISTVRGFGYSLVPVADEG